MTATLRPDPEKLYSFAAYAEQFNGERVMITGTVRATNWRSAEALAYDRCYEKFPRPDGWQGHAAIVAEVEARE
jgi:hypothetical protein